MHTDRKIGFAMGILLIGIVAALFFRNERMLETDVSGVRRESQLNERLRERDVAVYLNDSPEEGADESNEAQASPLRDVLRNMNERNKTRPSAVGSSTVVSESDRDGRPEPSLDGFRRVKDAPDEDAQQVVQKEESLPTHVTPQKLSSLFPPADSEPLLPFAESSAPTTSDFQPPEEFDEYTVKFGDTLSGIAQKTLGSPNRYREIYEANRDRMASPDRLDIGKSLRIPRTASNPPQT